MSMAFIRNNYAMSVKRGDRVLYSGGSVPQFGTVTGSVGAYLRIRLDGAKHSGKYHPTWMLVVMTRFDTKEVQP